MSMKKTKNHFFELRIFIMFKGSNMFHIRHTMTQRGTTTSPQRRQNTMKLSQSNRIKEEEEEDIKEFNEIRENITIENVKSILSTFIRMKGCTPYLKHQPSFLYSKLIDLPYFQDMVILAIHYGCTLLLSPKIYPNVEFYLSHLVKRGSRSQLGITLNGNYIKMSDKVSLYESRFNTTTTPWKPCQTLFSSFPKYMELNLNNDIVKTNDYYEMGMIDVLEITGNDVLVTPIGDLPILYVDHNFNIRGCNWGTEFDYMNGYVWNPVQTFVPFNKKMSNESKLPNPSQMYFFKYYAIWGQFDKFNDTCSEKWSKFVHSTECHELLDYTKLIRDNYCANNKDKTLEGRGEFFHSLINGIVKKYKGLNDVINVRESMNYYLSHILYEKHWPYEIEKNEHITIECCQQDKQIESKLFNLQFITMKDLLIDFLDTEEGHIGMDLVIHELRTINSYKIPKQKCVIIHSATKLLECVIYSLLPKNDNTVSADLFFPCTLYILIHGNIPFLCSNIKYIYAFVHDIPENIKYTLTNFDCCIELINSIEGSNCGWDNEIFKKHIEFRSKSSNPLYIHSMNVMKAFQEDKNPSFDRLIDHSGMTIKDKTDLLQAWKKVKSQHIALKQKLDSLI